MEAQQDRLGRQLKETKAFSPTSLFFGVLSSVVCTAVIPALGAGVPATLAGAALSPLLGAVITTQGHGLVRTIAIACVCSVAAIVTIGGFTLPELVAGRGSLTSDRDGTFVSTERARTSPSPTPTPTETPTGRLAPKVELVTSRKCPDAKVGETSSCRQVGIQNVGRTTVRIDSADLAGEGAGDFTVYKHCHGTLQPGSACSVRMKFRPTAVGVRTAVLTVHVDPGDADHRVTITGEGKEG